MSNHFSASRVKYLLWLVPVLGLLATSGRAQSAVPRQRVLIDKSGSMRGFFTEGNITGVQSILRDLPGASGETHYFIDENLVPVSDAPPEAFGSNTFLMNALKRGLAQEPAPSILWIVTDNQPSSGGKGDSDRDIEEFYKLLRGENIKRLYFFPLKLDFKGALFKQDDSVLTPNYAGKRGLLVYAMLLDETALDVFEIATNKFQEQFGSNGASTTQRILIKPLAQDTVTARIIPGQKFRLVNGELVSDEFNVDTPIQGDFKVELTSQFGQMKVSHAEIDVRVPNKFHTGDFAETEISPVFTPHDMSDFQPKNTRVVDVTLNAPGVHIRNNLISWWNCITHNRGEINGSVQISIKVPGQNFAVVEDLTKNFSTDKDIYENSSQDVQSKIYRLDDLVKRMMPAQQMDLHPKIGNRADGVIPIHLSVRYPKKPVVLLVLLTSLLLLMGFVVYRTASSGQTYYLTWDNGRYRAFPNFRLWPFIGKRIELDNRPAATITRSLSNIYVKAANGYSVDEANGRILSPSGTDFNLRQSPDGASITFFFASAASANRANSAGSTVDDDLFGEINYGSNPEPQEGAGIANHALPIRKPTTGRSDGDAVTSDGASTAEDSSVDLDDLFR